MFLRKAHSGKSDEELLDLYQSTGNLEWLSILYLRYASLVYAVCVKYLRDRDDAKDAVMGIHEKLIESLMRHKVANFRSWLYVNARNFCLMQLRSQKGRIKQEIDPRIMESAENGHPDDESVREFNISRLEKCIEALTGAQQQCVRLFFLQEKCYRDVATETGFDLNQVKSYIQNGKRNLKICMDKDEG